MKRLFICLYISFLSSLSFAQSEETPTPQWRPVYHFTPEKNWMNDPNGLIYLNGEYHMYYQYNPYSVKSAHKSWGHATSKDLIH
jgi:levanase/fructan beta-fructosidase